MLLSAEEIEMKSRIWLEENESFLKEQEGEQQQQFGCLYAYDVVFNV